MVKFGSVYRCFGASAPLVGLLLILGSQAIGQQVLDAVLCVPLLVSLESNLGVLSMVLLGADLQLERLGKV